MEGNNRNPLDISGALGCFGLVLIAYGVVMALDNVIEWVFGLVGIHSPRELQALLDTPMAAISIGGGVYIALILAGWVLFYVAKALRRGFKPNGN